MRKGGKRQTVNVWSLSKARVKMTMTAGRRNIFLLKVSTCKASPDDGTRKKNGWHLAHFCVDATLC